MPPPDASLQLAETRTVLSSQRSFLVSAHVALLLAGLGVLRHRPWLLLAAVAVIVLALIQNALVCHLSYRGERMPPAAMHAFTVAICLLVAACLLTEAWSMRV